MIRFDFATDVNVSSLVWITSLPPEQMGPTRRITKDLEAFLKTIDFPFIYYEIPNAAGLYQLLTGIADRARQGARPLLHLDMHGTEDGLWIAATDERAPWTAVVLKLQAINIATLGNLCVVAGVCHAYHAIKQIKIHEPCAMHMLIAPQDEVTFGFLEDSTVSFYREAFTSGQIDRAHREHLSDQLKVFYSERLLAVALATYIREACRGKSVRKRREHLLTEVLLRGEPRTPENLKRIRQRLKEGLKPDQALVDKYAGTFLAGRPCPYTIDDLLELVGDTDKAKA